MIKILFLFLVYFCVEINFRIASIKRIGIIDVGKCCCVNDCGGTIQAGFCLKQRKPSTGSLFNIGGGVGGGGGNNGGGGGCCCCPVQYKQ
ncbi:hypothetical protein DERP_004191 [Dermatophagoides pteronyssinus]|uniref:Uncharacterized protein n=1 Tax=Dermatophagoides pteronyssinus TaxID=6956 RepID=A0ABQ8J8G0_DERPT|nr:hypothetical protein DERP_004191 [Dermatophagoides pteronyssinus]